MWASKRTTARPLHSLVKPVKNRPPAAGAGAAEALIASAADLTPFPVEGRTRAEVTDTRQKQKLAAAGRRSGLGCRDSEGSAARGCSLQEDAMLRFLRGEDLTEME